MNKFAPLSQSEMDSASTPTLLIPSDDAKLVAPVPADAPPPFTKHYRHGESAMGWKYFDAQGALLFEVHRFDIDGKRKEVLPLTLWRDATGRLEWKWRGYPAPRPLYNLHLIAKHRDTPVVVVEGEKAADAARAIFTSSVVTTSQSGSQAAAKTDWSPLAGRKVLIWPDADAPGLKYAADVARTLTALGCEVSVIDAMALSALAPDGSKRELMEGWDAADAVSEWTDLPALRKAANRFAKPLEVAPSFISYGPFAMDANGLTIEVTKGQGAKAVTVDEWVSGPFEVLGATRDPRPAGPRLGQMVTLARWRRS